MRSRPKAIVSWSTGKDSAFALQRVREAGELEVVGILTTLTAEFARVSMHGVREALLDLQAQALGLRCHKVLIPFPCPNPLYEERMAEQLQQARREGVTHMVFGDLFLQDLRAYREALLAKLDMEGVFPLWGKDTASLARQMVHSGLKAVLTCVDPNKIDRTFAGKTFDSGFLETLPPTVDPCGENGEFHTFAYCGPMFPEAIPVRVGEVVEREGFVFADVLSAQRIENDTPTSEHNDLPTSVLMP